MNKNLLSRIGIIFVIVTGIIYLSFLLLPLMLNLVINNYIPQIAGEINKVTGLSAGLEDVRIVTTPKLTAGLKVKKFELYTPQKEHILTADKFQVKMSLLPILAKSIRIDTVQLDSADISLKFNHDGSLEMLEYFPVQEELSKEEANENVQSKNSGLPFGLKLSNHLPDIHVGKYMLILTDGKDNYELSGSKTDVTDFILNKSIKIKGSGKFVLKGREQFKYNINLYNKIMPEYELDELVFNQQQEDISNIESEPIDIIGILKSIYDFKFTANADINLKTAPDDISGEVKVSDVSLIDLPNSSADLIFKGNTININSNIYTAKDEVSKIDGNVAIGKNPNVDINFKSEVETANILKILQHIATIFNIKDLQTLSANGRLSADFNIKSDFKTVQSTGYLKIPSAKLYYGLYKIGIDNINADVSLANNNINIKNIGFNILGQPLKLFGTISENAVSDIHLTANKLNLRGLLIALGQASLMQDNKVNSGTVSMDVIIKGALDKINPVAKINVENINIKNVPADITVKAPSTFVNITSDGKTFGGTASSSNVWLINPALKVSIPKINANIKEDYVEITPTPVTIERIKVTISGKITDYLKEKLGLNFVTTGDIKSTLTGNMNVPKQSLDLTYATTNLSTIVIPMFDKSKMSFTGKLGITGSMLNPILNGSFSVPAISIPEIPVTMNQMDVKIQGTILNGSGTVKEFASGGIKAENLSSNFSLKGNDFYLKNLKGNSFGGKINGNIVYNLSNTKTTIDFNGEGMDAEKAIYGAVGIKKAMSGVLGFNAKLSLKVLNYNEMMKSMKGNVTFNIKDGYFLSIGRFESFLNASNIINDYLLKNTVAALVKVTGLSKTAQYNLLEGTMTFVDGYANINPIKSAGEAICYYVTGKYNLVNGTTNVVILGKLDSPIVAKLGPIGELSTTKILGYIPVFGTSTAKLLNIMTANPKGERIDLIPDLTNGSKIYKEFKVVFNGGIESASSVKSFKWLSQPDMSEIEKLSVKDTVKSVKTAVKTDVQTTVNNVNTIVESNKQLVKDVKQEYENNKEELKNLFKSFKGALNTTEATPSEANGSTEQKPTE